jgi:hypothetical protein
MGTSFRRRPNQPDYIDHFGLTSPARAAEWWKTHQGKSLAELQIEVMEWIIAEAEKQPDKYKGKEMDSVRDVLKQVQLSKTPRRPPSMFSR